MAIHDAKEPRQLYGEAVFKRANGEGYVLVAIALAPRADPIFDGQGRLGFAFLDRAAVERWAEARRVPDALAKLDRGERVSWESWREVGAGQGDLESSRAG